MSEINHFPPANAQVCSGEALLVNVGILPDGIWQMAARFQAGTQHWYALAC